MKSRPLGILAAFLISLTAIHVHAAPPGKTQNLTSPDQVPEGLAKSDWSSIRAAYEAGRHAFQPTDTGWQARNPGQQWTTKFDGRGFLAEPRDGGWQWGLELKSYGFPGRERSIGGTPAVKAAGTRLTYQWDAVVQEWWVNDARGLEHGFTVKERPAAPLNSQPSTLNFLLATRGTLHPRVSADAQGVLFQDASGAAVLNYTGLKVWDADGKILPSRFETVPTERGVHAASTREGETTLKRPEVRAPQDDATCLLLTVDERGARYPLTIDPIAQQAYLKPAAVGTTQETDQFGISVAVSGDTVVVGASSEDSSTTGVNSTPNESATFSGAAYVFVRSGTTWTQQAYLKPAVVGTSQGGDQFGWSVAISGDTIVVGAIMEASSTTGVNSTPNESASAAGAAYVFTRSGTTWTQQAYLKPAAVGTTQVGDQFGTSVAISGDTIVVGAWLEDSSTLGVNSTPNESASGSGAAYIFVRSVGVWTQQAYLKPAAVGTTQAGDGFGASTAISGDTIVIGASSEDSSTLGVNSTPDENAADSGAAYVFTRSGTTWTQQAYLKPAAVGTTQVGDGFGASTAISGDTIVIGASEDSSTTGVNSAPDESAANSGAAYTFTRNGTTWTQQAYLKPAAIGITQAGDFFGGSVAISGNTVVVGAVSEDSSSTGVNSTPNESASVAGAAYVFTILPTVAGIAPAGGSTAGGTSVTITGSDFVGVTAVAIGGTAATNVNVVSTTSITATTPAHLAGLVDVAVSSPGVTSTGVNLFTYVTPPSVVFVNPPGGPTAGGTTLQIYGVNFTGATGASIAGAAVTSFIVNSDSKITAITAAHGPSLPAAVSVTKPFVTGTGPGTFKYVNVSNTTDTDGDGLNDAAELLLGVFGFDPLVAQPALVNSFTFSNMLFTPAQVQALNVDTPLIQRDPGTGLFTLTLGLQKSTNLMPGSFVPFPFTGAGTSINGAGKIEFQFTSPDNAAFFRLEAQ